MKNDPSVALFYEVASEWFTRQQDTEQWSEQDQQAFEHWLQQDPRHQYAYEEISHTWLAFDHVERPTPPASKPETARSPSHTKSPRQSPKPGWRERLGLRWQPLLGGALSFCVALGMATWYWYQHRPQYINHIQTAQAEQRELSLPDGSVVILNRNSSLNVEYSPHERALELVQGEAFFQVAPQGDHRFVVKTANTEVRVIGTAFNVRRAPSTIYVSVREGVVNVSSSSDSQNHTTSLKAGDALRISVDTGRQRSSPSTSDRAGAWQTGQLIFKRTPLHEVIDELQVYMEQPITLLGTEIRQYPVSGFANTAHPSDFLDALAQLLPVQVQNLGPAGYQISGK